MATWHSSPGTASRQTRPSSWIAASLLAAVMATPAPAQQVRVFFGNLHSHTSYSDGSGTPEEAFRHARDVARLHFLAVTEHNHAGAEFGAGDRADGILIATRPNLYSGTLAAALIPAANRMTEDGRFVAIFGQEFSTINKGNHVNVFGATEVLRVPNGWFRALTQWLDQHPDETGQAPILQFNHPDDFDDQSTEYGADDFGTRANWIATMGRYAALIEVLNGPAMTRTDGRAPGDTMQSSFLAYLNRGFHLAPTADQDNHYRTWGTATEARTAVLAPALTRANILNALRSRHVYATGDRNLELVFQVNGHLIGDIIRTLPDVGDQLEITYTVHDADEPNAEYSVEIWSDDGGPGGAIARRTGSHSSSGNTPANQPRRITGIRYAGPGQYLFFKVRQRGAGGRTDRAWTAPVWFEPN